MDSAKPDGAEDKKPFSLVSITGEHVKVRVGPASIMRRRKMEEEQQKRRDSFQRQGSKSIPSNAKITAFQSMNLSCSRALCSSEEDLAEFKILSLEPFKSDALGKEEELEDEDILVQSCSEENIEDKAPDIAGILQNMPVIDVSGMFGSAASAENSVTPPLIAGPSSPTVDSKPPKAAPIILQQQPEVRTIQITNAFPVANNLPGNSKGSGLASFGYRNVPVVLSKPLSEPLPAEVLSTLKPVYSTPEVINISSDEEDNANQITFIKIG